MKNKFLALAVRNSIIFLLIITVFADCARRKKSELVWGKNLPRIGSQSSPRATDLNGDGTLDIVHCQYFHTMDLLSFLGMRIKRIATPIRMKGDVLWGSYMGTLGDGLFRKSI